MRYLLDTHAFLWWLFDDPKLSSNSRYIIQDPNHTISVSSACVWEIATKYRLGKLSEAREVATDISGWIQKTGFVSMPITTEHAQLAGSWKVNHRDPFDRMLAAQSKLENTALVTTDKAFELFNIEIIW